MILLRCGHWLPPATNGPDVKFPGVDRWRDLYYCRHGCGLQRRESNTDRVRRAKAKAATLQ